MKLYLAILLAFVVGVYVGKPSKIIVLTKSEQMNCEEAQKEATIPFIVKKDSNDNVNQNNDDGGDDQEQSPDSQTVDLEDDRSISEEIGDLQFHAAELGLINNEEATLYLTRTELTYLNEIKNKLLTKSLIILDEGEYEESKQGIDDAVYWLKVKKK